MIDPNILAQLSVQYSKTNLEKGMLPFVKKFYQQMFLKEDIDKDMSIIFEKISDKKVITKPELTAFCFSVFANEIIYKKFLFTLPQHIQLLLEKLLWVEGIVEAEIEVLIDQKITTQPKFMPSNSFYDVKSEYYFFTVIKYITHSYPEKGFYILTISPYLKQLMVNYYPRPAHYYFVPINEIPATSFRFNAESLIINELPKVLSYYMQNGIKYAGKGKPLDGTLNKLQRSCGIKEFEMCIADDIGKIRSNLIAGMLYNFKVNTISIDTVSIIKELFTNTYKKLHSVQFILTQIKGWGYMDDNYDYEPNIEQAFLDIAKQTPSGEWISCKNMIELIECRFIKLQPVTNNAIRNRLYYNRKFEGYSDLNFEEKVYVVGHNKALVYLPFIKGTIFLYAAFGLIEIAVNEIDTKKFGESYFSAYDGLAFFKLTALGAYVFGHTATYESEFNQQKNNIQLNEDSLMILAEGEMEVLDIMLANFAEKAGANRYKVTHNHFLKNCTRASDIDKKIALFTQTISTKLPTYWLQQFEMWKLNAIKITTDTSTKIFKIPEKDKELQKLIAQDSVLKGLILKAEQFNILVPVQNVLKFKARMKELCYLIE